MPNREILMEALTLCANGEPCMGKKYRTCPYSPIGKPEHYNCGAAMAAGVLALLREQKPVEPDIGQVVDGVYAVCANCRYSLKLLFDAGGPKIGYSPKFCPECGRKVKWDETD